MRFLLLNQTFHPDVMATGQYLTEVALALVERGHEITVVTSRRAYDHPETLFPKEETWRGVRIIRVASTGFGKAAWWRRAADFASFLAQCAWRLAFLPRHDVLVALTSPPLISFIATCAAWIRGSGFVYWVMDMNPDEAIAAGWLRARSPGARLLEWMSRFSLRRATRVIALDHFMRDRIAAKGISAGKIAVLPPWSHDSEAHFDASERDRFRKVHGLEGKFVVMYSGNHSPCHPLDTLLEAARRLAAERDVVFCFVGGGSEWHKIKGLEMVTTRSTASPNRGLASPMPPILQSIHPSLQFNDLTHSASRTPHLLCLPYQPLSKLAGSLSAADLHVVVMGDPFVGIVHPCKIYNILNVGAPVLYIGPPVSHLSEIAETSSADMPWFSARHGDVDRVVKHIYNARAAGRRPDAAPAAPLSAGYADRQSFKSPTAGDVGAPSGVRARFSKEAVLPNLIRELEGHTP